MTALLKKKPFNAVVREQNYHNSLESWE